MTRSAVRLRARDSGFSLIEVMVSMSVMSIVVVLFTGGIVQLYKAQNRSEAVTGVSQQIHTAFVRLDRDIRYSAGISVPGTGASGNEYVEYQITNTGAVICTQLRITPAGRLQTRKKIDSAAAGPWSVLASQLVDPSSFTRTPASDGGNAYQQLVVSLTAQADGAAATEKETAAFTFTALNTAISTSSDTVCNSLDRQ
jgi:prepilin-type N-terminal cleavage/methylation domain-containing protein